MKHSYKDILSLTALASSVATAYLLIMFVVYPLFMWNGYVGIDESKFMFYLYTSIGGVLLLLLTGFIPLAQSFKKFSATDGFVLAFLLFSLFSYLFSVDRSEAFLGTAGWFMGLVSILLYLVLYILISRLWEFKQFVVNTALVAASIVFIIALLDRFSLYLIPLEVRAPSFLSTIGNINWLMGYYSVFAPIGIGLFLMTLKKRGRCPATYLYAAFTFIAFAEGFAQGSESVFLFDIALLLGLLFLSYKNIVRPVDVVLTAALYFLAAFFVRILRLLISNGYNYDSDGLCGEFTSSNIPVLMAVALLIIYIFIKNKSVFENGGKIYYIMAVVLAVLMISWIVLGILNTSGIIQGPDSDIFKFDTSFGHGRGEIYKVAVMGFGRMNFRQKLLGVGPDCFSTYLYGFNDICAELIARWPFERAANAHCELLTVLINGGLLGLASYLGIFTSFIANTVRKHGDEYVWCITLAVFCYIVHNLISFSQVLNTPFIFILMGMAQSLKNRSYML